MNILFCGGGTSGHITPAIAIAEKITELNADAKIAFVGRAGGLENRTIEKRGHKLYTLPIEGIQRSLSLKNIKRFCLALNSINRAKKIISEFEPDIVVGTGGYVCWPVIEAARSMKIKTALHESNSTPGLVTKLLYKKCDLMLLGCDNEFKGLYKHKNLKKVGNPTLGDFGKITRREARRILHLTPNEKFILSVGGSGGASVLNDMAIGLMSSFSVKNKNIRHLHGCGDRYYKEIQNSHPDLCGNKKLKCRILPSIENMAVCLAAADLVISRCGAITLAEIALSGTPAILIPSPNVTANHQLKNAKAFSESGAAILIEESELTAERLLSECKKIIFGKEVGEILKKSLCALAAPDAAKNSAEEILRLL